MHRVDLLLSWIEDGLVWIRDLMESGLEIKVHGILGGDDGDTKYIVIQCALLGGRMKESNLKRIHTSSCYSCLFRI